MTGPRDARSVKIGKGDTQGCRLLPIMLNLYSKYITKKVLEGFVEFKIGGQVK
jgi:hypothetical protein